MDSLQQTYATIIALVTYPQTTAAPPFLPQSAETHTLAKHQTVGIDVCISPDRFILLDTQPIFSPSVLIQMIKSEAKIPVSPADVGSYESLHELQVRSIVRTVILVVYAAGCVHFVGVPCSPRGAGLDR